MERNAAPARTLPRESLRFTLILGSGLGILAPALVLVTFLATTRLHDAVEQRLLEPLRQYAPVLDSGMATAVWNEDQALAQTLITAVMVNPDVVGVLVFEEGDKPFAHQERRGVDDRDVLREIRSLARNGQVLGRVEVVLSPARVRGDVLGDLTGQVLALLAQVLLSFLIVWLLLDRRLVRPLTGLQGSLSRIARGELDQPLTWKRHDEIGRLAQGLEAMRADLAALIRDRREAEVLHRTQAAQLRALLDTIPDLVWLKNPAGVYLACNHRFEQFFGAPEAQILGKTDYDFVDQSLADFFRENDRKAMAAGVPTINEEDVRFADGHFERLETVKTPIGEPGGEVIGVLGIGRDITGRRRAEEEKSRLQTQLLQSQKMESLGLLAGGVAHDMNNVLGAILVVASTYQKTHPEGAARRSFDTIARAAERGAKLVKRLLGFSYRVPDGEHDVDLNALVREQADLLGQTSPGQVRIETDLETGLLSVRGDENALVNVLMNLSVNALDAMAGQGTLSFRTRNLPGLVELVIADTGSGMPPAILEKAFDPFFTTKPVGQGTGLGLSLVYTTVRVHQGTVTLDSAPGEGTRVTLTFPSTGPRAPVLPPPEPSPSERGSPGQAILLIDDDELILESLGELLREEGYEVTTAPSGEAALGLLADSGAPDWVILDMNMPGLGGAGTLPRLKDLCPGVPVVLSSGRGDPATATLAARYPGTVLLPKPFPLEDLRAILRGRKPGPGASGP